jgi:hypothetical protein
MRNTKRKITDVKEIIKRQRAKRISFKQNISNKKFINNEVD